MIDWPDAAVEPNKGVLTAPGQGATNIAQAVSAPEAGEAMDAVLPGNLERSGLEAPGDVTRLVADSEEEEAAVMAAESDAGESLFAAETGRAGPAGETEGAGHMSKVPPRRRKSQANALFRMWNSVRSLIPFLLA